MKVFFAATISAALLANTPVSAQPASFHALPLATPVQPSAIPLYPDGTLPPSRTTERWNHMVGQMGPIRVDERSVRNVTRPTITPVLPSAATATGAAVIVAPGGAFQSLSIDHEGFDVARWLAAHGIAAFVLQYRLLETPDDNDAFLAQMGRIFAQAAASGGHPPDLKDPAATEDALQALRVVRAGAARWQVDPARVGMIGFSAGAMTSMQAMLHAPKGEMPAFMGYIYGPMIRIEVPANAPPMFAALAIDDGLFGKQGFGVVDAWHAAGRPVELHAYERGDHGFGMGRPGTTTTLLMDEFYAWLRARGVLVKADK